MGLRTFRFTCGHPPYWHLENVLSPEGTLRKQNPMGSIRRLSILLWSRIGSLDNSFQKPLSAFLRSWKCFIPRRDPAEQSPKVVQLFLLSITNYEEKWRTHLIPRPPTNQPTHPPTHPPHQIKHFQDFKKADYRLWNWNPQYLFLHQ